MPYVLKRTPDGAYVADPRKNPTGRSYTRKLEHATVFPTREAADRDRCPGNEVIVSLDEVLECRN